jgi:hypothetical protein
MGKVLGAGRVARSKALKVCSAFSVLGSALVERYALSVTEI